MDRVVSKISGAVECKLFRDSSFLNHNKAVILLFNSSLYSYTVPSSDDFRREGRSKLTKNNSLAN